MSTKRLSRWIEAAHEEMAALTEQAGADPYTPDTIIDRLFKGLSQQLEELKVIDEELEEQNQLLLETRAGIGLEHQRYHDLFEFAPYAYVVSDRAGVIREVNQAGSDLLHAPVKRLIGKPLRTFIAPPDRARFFGILEELNATQALGKWEIRIQPRNNQSWIDAAVRTAPFLDRNGELTMLCWMIRDITHRKHMEASLRKANEDLSMRVRESNAGMQMAINALLESREHLLLAKQAGEIGIWDWDPHTGDLTIDDQCAHFIELDSPRTMKTSEYIQHIYPEDRERVTSSIEEDILRLHHPEHEFRITLPDNRIRWLYSRAIGVFDQEGKMQRVTGIVMDITHRKRAAEEEQHSTVQAELQHLLIDQREKERMRIARDLHDGPLQELIGTAFALQSVIQDVGDAPQADSLKTIKTSLQYQIEELRAFAGQLRSATLFKFGLQKAIRDHLEGLQQKYPEVSITVIADPEDPPLPQTLRLALYRICQESLSNAIRHGNATEIHVSLCFSAGAAKMQIQDNGKGFQLPTEWIELARAGHLGLVGIRERAEAVGGQLEIDSFPGKGATILITAPIKPEDELNRYPADA